eukprot:637924_1
MNAFTVLLAAFGLGLATAAQQVMPCDVKYGVLMGELQECSKIVNPNATTLEMGITSAKDMCNKCVTDLKSKRSDLMKACGKSTENLKKFDGAVTNAEQTCGANKLAHCAAAEDFLTGKKSTLARAQKRENTNMACTCAKPDMRPKNITKATCSQRKMKFNCAKLKKAGNGNDNKDVSPVDEDGKTSPAGKGDKKSPMGKVDKTSPADKNGKTSEEVSETTEEGSDESQAAKLMEVPSDGETCLQLFARDRAEFCKSECVKMLQEAGGQLDEKCRDDSPGYEEFNIDFEKTCKCEDMKCLVFRDSKTDSEPEKSSANSAQVGLASAVFSMMVVVFSA